MTKWWKDDNGNRPRALGPASERLLRTIARHDKGEGVHFKHLPGDRFQLVGTDYRVAKKTFHPFYDEYMGDNPTNGPLTEEISADVGFYVKVTDAGREWIRLRDEGQVPGMDKRPVARTEVEVISAEQVIASALEDARSSLRRITRLADQLKSQDQVGEQVVRAAFEAPGSVRQLVRALESDLRMASAARRVAEATSLKLAKAWDYDGPRVTFVTTDHEHGWWDKRSGRWGFDRPQEHSVHNGACKELFPESPQED